MTQCHLEAQVSQIGELSEIFECYLMVRAKLLDESRAVSMLH